LIKPNSTISSEKVRFLAALVCGFFFSPASFAASCCAGNAAAPALISGDERMQMDVLFSHSSVVGNVEEGVPVFWSPKESETTQTVRIDAATLISDRWQIGTMVPVVQQQVNRQGLDRSATALGDVRMNVGYEILPEWTYSVWRPKGYVFAQLMLPTGKSSYDTSDFSEADAVGRGFYTVALGSLLVKRWSSWDAFLIPELHYGFARRFDVTELHDAETVSPRLGASVGFGGGWSYGPLRVGLRFQPVYNQPKKIQTSSNVVYAGYQLSWDTGADLTYLVGDDWSVTGSYTDQTLLGPAVNSYLSRTFALMLQRRWDR
jgi:hypothetical protein